MNCAACNNALRPGQRFCEFCGRAAPRACHQCHALVAADARFCGMCGVAQGTQVQSPAAVEAERDASADAHHGERRQLTVLFADVVGATALSGQLDPEALRDLLRAYQRVCSRCIDRYGGRIQQYLGDGVLAYFGYPAAHDNEAERAVLAASALVAEVAQLSAGRRARGEIGVQVRVGVHTGLVVIGAMGADESPVNLAVGETPNLAARVQVEAAPDSVCISEATRRLLGPRFQLRPLGERLLKGVDKASSLFAVEGVSDEASESEAERCSPPLVGRDAELHLLGQRWDMARHGHGQAVLVSGEGGIGKSRLLTALREAISPQSQAWRTLRCSPFHANSALHPVIDLIERAIAARHSAVPEDREAILRRLLTAAAIADAASHALIASLLGLGQAQANELALGDLSPVQRRQRTLDALIAWLQADARMSPVVIAVEDLHWIDPSSRELFGLLLERLPDLPILLVMTFRPDFVSPWPMRSHVSTIALPRMDSAAAAAIARGLAAGRDLPQRVIDEIVRRTDGVPLFVEELTKAIVAAGLIVEREGAWQLAESAGDALEVPTTLRDSLTSRLDRLGTAKSLAQLVSVIGREFDYEMLRSVCDLPEADLESQLATLNRADIVQQSGVPPRANYRFKHALIQEAAYDTLLNSVRALHHRRVAEAYVSRFSHVLTSKPELAAHHFSRASLPEPAATYWRQAGELALARSGHEEAIAHLGAGLAQVGRMPSSDARAAAELGLRVALGPALMARMGFGSAETGENYARACELAAGLGESSDRFAAMWGDWLFKNTRGQLVAAAERSEELVILGRSLADDGYLLQAHHSRWTNLLFLGQVADARADVLRGLHLFDPVRHRHHKHLYGGHDPCVCAHNFGSAAACAMGHADEARQLIGAALANAREQGHMLTLSTAMMFAAIVLHDLGDADGAVAAAEELLTVCQRHGFAQWTGIGQAALGAALIMQGQGGDGIAAVEAGVEAHTARGPAGLALPVFAMAAQGHLRCGSVQRAQALLEQALELADRTRVGWWRPEIERLLVEALLRESQIPIETAADRLHAAASRARSQGAAAQEIRALNAALRLGPQDAGNVLARQRLKALCGTLEGSGSADARAAVSVLANGA